MGDRFKSKAEKKRYFAWRTKVLNRDHRKCVICGLKKNLEAHHIIPWSKSVKFRFLVANGITLCRRHHHQVHKAKG